MQFDMVMYGLKKMENEGNTTDIIIQMYYK